MTTPQTPDKLSAILKEDVVSGVINGFISVMGKPDKDGYYQEYIHEDEFNNLKKAVKKLLTKSYSQGLAEGREEKVRLFKPYRRTGKSSFGLMVLLKDCLIYGEVLFQYGDLKFKITHLKDIKKK